MTRNKHWLRAAGHPLRVVWHRSRRVRSSRRLLSCHRPDRRRRAGGRHQVNGRKPGHRSLAWPRERRNHTDLPTRGPQTL